MKTTQRERVEMLLKEGWTTPLDAWNEFGILTSFRSRVSEIREDYQYRTDYVLEEKPMVKPNRFGEPIHFKALRLRRVI